MGFGPTAALVAVTAKLETAGAGAARTLVATRARIDKNDLSILIAYEAEVSGLELKGARTWCSMVRKRRAPAACLYICVRLEDQPSPKLGTGIEVTFGKFS